MGEQWSLTRSSVAIMAGILLGSLAGFLRALVIARTFGAGAGTDALFAALAVPQALYDQFLGAAAVAIFIPALSRTAHAPEEFWATARRIGLGVAVSTALAAGCLEVCAGWLMPLLVSGFKLRMHGYALATSITLVRILAPGLILMGLSGVGTSALYALGKRSMAAGSIALYHLGVTSAALIAGAAWGVRALAVGAVIGWSAQVILVALVLLRHHLWSVRRLEPRNTRPHTKRFPIGRSAEVGTAAPVPVRLGSRSPSTTFWKPSTSRRRTGTGAAVPTEPGPQPGIDAKPAGAGTEATMPRLFLPLAVAGVAGIAVQVADLHFKSSLPESGGLSAMQYATQLIQFPVGLLGAAIALAVLPAISRETSWHGRHEALGAGVRLGFAIMLPPAIALMTLGSPIVALVFQRGSFAAPDTSHTAAALLGYAPQLPFVALSQVLMLAYFARRNTLVPALVNILGVVVYVALAALLLPRLTITGLAVANSASLALQALAFALLLGRRWPRLRWREVLAGASRFVVAGAFMALTIVATSHALGGNGSATLARAAQVLIPGGLGLAAYMSVLAPRLRWPLRSPVV